MSSACWGVCSDDPGYVVGDKFCSTTIISRGIVSERDSRNVLGGKDRASLLMCLAVCSYVLREINIARPIESTTTGNAESPPSISRMEHRQN